MKWLKRLLLLVVFFAIFSGAILAAGWWMSRRPPEWFSRRHATPQEQEAAAHRADLQVQRTLNWAADQQAYTDSRRVGPPSTQPERKLEVALSEDELNGFFQKWDQSFGWSRRYDPYIADPQIVLRDGQLLIAAMVKDMGTVVTVEFAPRLEAGSLRMPVERVMAGRLPLPQSFWSTYQRELIDKLKQNLPRWQDGARIRDNGTANSDAVAAAMTELLLDILRNKPARPFLFLPYNVSNSQRSLPVKLTDVQIANRVLTLTVEPLNAQDRDILLQSIRAPETNEGFSAANHPSEPVE